MPCGRSHPVGTEKPTEFGEKRALTGAGPGGCGCDSDSDVACARLGARLGKGTFV